MNYGMLILFLVFKTIMEFVKYCHNDDKQVILFLFIVDLAWTVVFYQMKVLG